MSWCKFHAPVWRLLLFAPVDILAVEVEHLPMNGIDHICQATRGCGKAEAAGS
jgi:hypothetical protein